LAEVAPWGQESPQPLFDGAFVILDQHIVGEAHVRMRLQPLGGTSVVNAIAFGAADEQWARGSAAIHVAYRLAVNEYRGARSVQMIVEHARHLDRSPRVGVEN
jgi:single-stranded-DNA-specific exonuclease